MAQRHCTAQEAFDVLVDLSSRSNTKLRDVAQALVDQAVQATQSR
jgi:AmiR/NasT family two-component response regulator